MKHPASGSRRPPERLHTELLEAQFGPISVKVLHHDTRLRKVHLVDARGVSRTFGLTFLSRPMPVPIRAIDGELRSGQFIGKAFVEHGYAIRKNMLDYFVLETAPWLRTAFHVKERYALTRFWECYVLNRRSAPLIYGTVCEVFSPAFRPPVLGHEDMAYMGAVTRELLKRGFSREEIWRRIGRRSGWIDVEARFLQARVAALPLVFELRRKVADILAPK
jgi:hypothetical protein